MKQTSRFCKTCNAQVIAAKPKINHILHLLLTMFTGVWLVIWIVLAMRNSMRPLTCTRCGLRV